MIDTRTVTDRRKLAFSSMEDIRADVDALDGRALRKCGNWTPAQNVQHIATVIGRSIDGFGGLKAALPLRLIVRLIRGRMLREPFRPGIRLPAKFRVLMPEEIVGWDAAVADLRRQIGRVGNGERMTAPSPVFGSLTHEQWAQLHCRHAELHLSFIRADG